MKARDDICECGGMKEPGAEACQSCEDLDGIGAAGMVIAALRACGGRATTPAICLESGLAQRTTLRALALLLDRGQVERWESHAEDHWHAPTFILLGPETLQRRRLLDRWRQRRACFHEHRELILTRRGALLAERCARCGVRWEVRRIAASIDERPTAGAPQAGTLPLFREPAPSRQKRARRPFGEVPERRRVSVGGGAAVSAVAAGAGV